jgi:hypothetical protein
MGEIASTHNRDALALRPPRKMLYVAVLTAGQGELGVDVQVGVEQGVRSALSNAAGHGARLRYCQAGGQGAQFRTLPVQRAKSGA